MKKAIFAVLALTISAACGGNPTLPTPMESEPSLTTVTSRGLKVTYPGTAYDIGGGARNVTCRYRVTVVNTTGQTLWGTVIVTLPRGGLISQKVTSRSWANPLNKTFIPGRTEVDIEVVGPRVGFNSTVTFALSGAVGAPYVNRGNTYCTYM